jgi:hypothetical protein
MHAFGPDDLPVQAEITFEGGLIGVKRPVPDSTGLCVQVDVPSPGGGGSLGRLTLQTALLPNREEPYLLSLELARRQIMLFLNKLEEWGLFDFSPAEMVLRQFEAARQRFTASLVAAHRTPTAELDPRAEADRLAWEALSLAVDAGERLALLDAEKQFPARLTGQGYSEAVRTYTKLTAETPAQGAAIALSSHTGVVLPGLASMGISVEPTQFAEPLHKAVAAGADFVAVPMRWSEMEPGEGKYAFGNTDRWIEWAIRSAKLPVVAGPLLDFRASCLPEWLFIWENDYETLRDLVVEHLQQVVTRYRRTVSRWTVASGLHVNSDFNLSVDQIIDLTRVATAVVRKLHPQGRIQLAIDEPWGEYHASRKRSIPPLLYADALMQVGVNVDALGVRVAMGQGTSGRTTRDLMSLSSMLDRYAQFNRPLAITAVGVPSAANACEPNRDSERPVHGGCWRAGWSESAQADWTSQALGIMLAKPYVQSVCWQQLADPAPSGYSEMPGGGLVTAAGQPKPVLERWIQTRAAIRAGRAPAGIPNFGAF